MNKTLKVRATEKSIEEILREGGIIARKLKYYEERKEQIQMAAEIERAIHQSEHLIVEAGTEIGKSLAYLIPFIYWTMSKTWGSNLNNTLHLTENIYIF